MDLEATHTHQLYIVHRKYPDVRQNFWFVCQPINHIPGKYSTCKCVMPRAQKDNFLAYLFYLAWSQSLSFSVFSSSFFCLRVERKKCSWAVPPIQHLEVISLCIAQNASRFPSLLKYLETFLVLSTSSGAEIRKRAWLLFFLISNIKNHWSDRPTTTTLNFSQIRVLSLDCSQIIGIGGFQDFIWPSYSSSPSLLTCGTKFFHVYTARKKITLDYEQTLLPMIR